MPVALFDRILDDASLVRVWREFRGLKARELADAGGWDGWTARGWKPYNERQDRYDNEVAVCVDGLFGAQKEKRADTAVVGDADQLPLGLALLIEGSSSNPGIRFFRITFN